MPVRSFTAKFKDEFKDRILEAVEGRVISRERLNAQFDTNH
jgi:hypothetical protein